MVLIFISLFYKIRNFIRNAFLFYIKMNPVYAKHKA